MSSPVSISVRGPYSSDDDPSPSSMGGLPVSKHGEKRAFFKKRLARTAVLGLCASVLYFAMNIVVAISVAARSDQGFPRSLILVLLWIPVALRLFTAILYIPGRKGGGPIARVCSMRVHFGVVSALLASAAVLSYLGSSLCSILTDFTVVEGVGGCPDLDGLYIPLYPFGLALLGPWLYWQCYCLPFAMALITSLVDNLTALGLLIALPVSAPFRAAACVSLILNLLLCLFASRRNEWRQSEERRAREEAVVKFERLVDVMASGPTGGMLLECRVDLTPAADEEQRRRGRVNLAFPVTFTTRGCERILGFPPHEAVGKAYSATLVPEDLAAMRKSLWDGIAGSDGVVSPAFKSRHRRKLPCDGTIVHCEFIGYLRWAPLSDYPELHRLLLQSCSNPEGEGSAPAPAPAPAPASAHASAPTSSASSSQQPAVPSYTLPLLPFVKRTPRGMVVLSGVMGFERDITAEAEREENARQAAAARLAANTALAAQEKALAFVAHELRGPLFGIIASLEILKEAVAEQLDDDSQKDFEAIATSAAAMKRLVEETLDVSKLSEGKVTIKPASFALPELLHEICNSFRSFACVPILPPSVGPGVPSFVMADALRVRQILSNAISNSCKLTFKGCIGIKVTLEKDHYEQDPQCCQQALVSTGRTMTTDPDGPACPGKIALLRLEAWDTGVGLKGADSESLFVSYNQGPSAMLGRERGTGLGLPIIRSIAEAMGGTLTIAEREDWPVPIAHAPKESKEPKEPLKGQDNRSGGAATPQLLPPPGHVFRRCTVLTALIPVGVPTQPDESFQTKEDAEEEPVGESDRSEGFAGDATQPAPLEEEGEGEGGEPSALVFGGTNDDDGGGEERARLCLADAHAARRQRVNVGVSVSKGPRGSSVYQPPLTPEAAAAGGGRFASGPGSTATTSPVSHKASIRLMEGDDDRDGDRFPSPASGLGGSGFRSVPLPALTKTPARRGSSATPSEETATTRSSARAKGSLLFVDDDVVSRRLCSRLLAKKGWNVTAGSSSMNALSILTRGAPYTAPRLRGAGASPSPQSPSGGGGGGRDPFIAALKAACPSLRLTDAQFAALPHYPLGSPAWQEWLASEQRWGGFAVITSDIEMPGIRGDDLVRILRFLGCDLPIVAVTGETRPDELRTLQSAGFDAVVTKPFINLDEQIAKAVGSRQDHHVVCVSDSASNQQSLPSNPNSATVSRAPSPKPASLH